MARLIHLQSGVNLITTTDNQENIGSVIPTTSTSEGFAKGIKGTNTDLDSETGFFINTDKNFELWIFYSNSGWQLFADVDVIANQGDFATGISVAWLNSTVHGEALGAYFRTDETDHEIRIIRRTKRIKMDLLAGDPDVEKDALVHSLAAANLDYDGEVTGAGTIAHIDVDVSSYIAGQVVTFQREGDFYYGLVQVNNGEELESTLTYNYVTNLMTLTFVLPIEHTEDDNYEFHVSLKESSAPAPTYQLTADNYSVDEGQTVTVTLNTANVTDGTQLPYTISGTNIDLNDFDGLGSLTGTFTVNGETATTSFVTAADQTTEGTEVFTLALDNGEAAVSVTINDTSTNPPPASPASYNGFKFIATVGDDNYGDGSLEMRLGGRGNYTVDWGDGTLETVTVGPTDNGYEVPVHNYATAGNYEIHMYNGNSTFHLAGVASWYSASYYNSNTSTEYVAADDTNGDGPFTLGRPVIASRHIPDLSNITSISGSGQTATIVDSSNYDYASYFNGSSFSNVEKVLMQVTLDNGHVGYAPVTITTSGDTTTFTVSRGEIRLSGIGQIDARLADKGLAQVILDMSGGNGLKTILCPNLTAIPDFKIWVGTYSTFSDRLWNYVDNQPAGHYTSKVTQITNWGAADFEFTTTHGVNRFDGLVNMIITASDEPDFTNQTDFTVFFRNCSSLTDPNNTLNTNKLVHSGVTTLDRVFEGCSVYAPSTLNNWDVSGCLYFNEAFERCSLFNATLDEWVLNTDPSNTINMGSMFLQAYTFNQSLNTNQRADGQIAWDTQRVSNMANMFYDCVAFNQSIEYWNTSINGSFQGMHINNYVYNQPINTQEVTVGGNTYTAWDTSNSSSFKQMFWKNYQFNQDITNWDISNAYNLAYIFAHAYKFNQPIDTHSVTVAGNTYTAWDVKRSTPNTSHSTKFDGIFFQARHFNQDLSNWDFSDTTRLFQTFQSAFSFQGLGAENWDMSGITSLSGTFNGCYFFNPDLSSWDCSNVVNWYRTFMTCRSLMFDFANWNYTISPTSMQETFSGVGVRGDLQDTNQTEMDFSNWDVSGCTNFKGTFYGEYAHAPGPETTALTDYILPGNAETPQTFPNLERTWVPLISNWDVSNATTMHSMFTHNPRIATNSNFDISSWDVSNVEDTTYMFKYCTGFDGQMTSNWNLSSLAIGVGTFYGTNGLTTLNVSNWLSDSLTSPNQMFRDNPNFEGNGVENWNINPACTKLSEMFMGCTAFTGDVSNWDVRNITHISNLFYVVNGSTNTIDVSSWTTQSLTTVTKAFGYASVDWDPTNWDIRNITTGLNNWTLGDGAQAWDQTRLDSVLATWGAQTPQNGIDLIIDTGGNASTPTSGAALTGYNNLINNYNWTISIT